MKVYRSIRSLTKEIQKIKKQGKTVGFVPTMGFLHEGHMSLVRRARKDTDCVVVSIFVNPIQFGPKEDFKRYPRDLRHDLGLCRKEAVNLVFIPQYRDMYPEVYLTYVNVEVITDKMCGASRPGHFRGVATVVAKLFNIVMPDIAYFGQKDAQQAIVIRKMVEDLNMPVKIRVMPIVREKDGLAMSSRNVYLNAEERKKAACLYKSLRLAKDLFKRGERDTGRIIKRMQDFIKRQGNVRIDYVSIVDTNNLKEIQRIAKKALVAVAVWIGKTRLMDNIILS